MPTTQTGALALPSIEAVDLLQDTQQGAHENSHQWPGWHVPEHGEGAASLDGGCRGEGAHLHSQLVKGWLLAPEVQRLLAAKNCSARERNQWEMCSCPDPYRKTANEA